MTPPGAIAPDAKRATSMPWLGGVACGMVATLATPTALLLCLLLLPVALALLVDPRPGRPVLRPIWLCGLAAALRPLLMLWRDGHTIDASLSLATDAGVVATAWAAQAAGWLMAELAPLAVRLTLEAGALARSARLRAERADYEVRWGFPARMEGDASAAER
jgi:hypothetical protein